MPAASATPETTGTLSSAAPSAPLESAEPSAPPPSPLPLEPETLVKGLPLELCDQYQISPQMLWRADISLGNMILTAITSRPDRKKILGKIYAERCDNSGVRLLQLLYAECDNLNGSSQNLIVDKMAKVTQVTHAGFG